MISPCIHALDFTLLWPCVIYIPLPRGFNFLKVGSQINVYPFIFGLWFVVYFSIEMVFFGSYIIWIQFNIFYCFQFIVSLLSMRGMVLWSWSPKAEILAAWNKALSCPLLIGVARITQPFSQRRHPWLPPE